MLTIIDVRGCIYQYCRMVTCGCCSGSSGSLTIEPGATACSYVFTASVTSSSDEACEGHDAFIEYQILEASKGCVPESFEVCACADPTCDNSCGRAFLLDGQTGGADVDTSAQVRWRVWDKTCGCAGPWVYADLPCQPCEFCDGKYDGFDVTVSSLGECVTEGFDCNCAPLNQEYRVPRTYPCAGTKVFNDMTCTVDPDSTPLDVSLMLFWSIWQDVDGYWIDVGYTFDGGGSGPTDFVTLFLGEELPVCIDIETSGIAESEPVFCLWCETSSVGFSIKAYAA